MKLQQRSLLAIPAIYLMTGLLFHALAQQVVENAAIDVRGWSSAFFELQLEPGCDKDMRELARCASLRAQHSEEFLRLVISEIDSRVYEEQKAPFRAANDFWFQYRDASCRFDSVLAGGSSAVFRQGECVHAYNIERIHILEMYGYCLTGGDCANDLQLYYIAPARRANSASRERCLTSIERKID